MVKNINNQLVSALRKASQSFFRNQAYSLVVLACSFLSTQFAWAQSAAAPDASTDSAKAAPLPPVMPVEDRLPYLRKLKAFLEEGPLDIAAFERQFDLKLECKPWRTTGKVCKYRPKGPQWPYAEFTDRSSVITYSMYGDGTDDLLRISLMYPDDRYAYNCITGTMAQQVFTPPGWTAEIDRAVTRIPNPHPSEVPFLALHGHDRQLRRVEVVTIGVAECTGTLQITVHPNTP